MSSPTKRSVRDSRFSIVGNNTYHKSKDLDPKVPEKSDLAAKDARKSPSLAVYGVHTDRSVPLKDEGSRAEPIKDRPLMELPSNKMGDEIAEMKQVLLQLTKVILKQQTVSSPERPVQASGRSSEDKSTDCGLAPVTSNKDRTGLAHNTYVSLETLQIPKGLVGFNAVKWAARLEREQKAAEDGSPETLKADMRLLLDRCGMLGHWDNAWNEDEFTLEYIRQSLVEIFGNSGTDKPNGSYLLVDLGVKIHAIAVDKNVPELHTKVAAMLCLIAELRADWGDRYHEQVWMHQLHMGLPTSINSRVGDSLQYETYHDYVSAVNDTLDVVGTQWGTYDFLKNGRTV